MTNPYRQELERAYNATSYFVDSPQGRFAIRIGTPSPKADSLLEVHETKCWAFVTACNPASERQFDAENARRHSDLERSLQTAGYRYYPGEGVGDSGAWPAEKSFFIVGIAEAQAVEIAKKFGQNAIVMGEPGEPPRLIFIQNA